MNLVDLGMFVSNARKRKKWTQDDLENYSGITKRTISKVEQGLISEVGIKKIEKILDSI